LVACIAIGRVVTVLFSSAGVARRRLDVAIPVRADPDIGPCRRNGERVEALAQRRVLDALSARRVVAPAGAGASSADADDAVGDVDQPRPNGRLAVFMVA